MKLNKLLFLLLATAVFIVLSSYNENENKGNEDIVKTDNSLNKIEVKAITSNLDKAKRS